MNQKLRYEEEKHLEDVKDKLRKALEAEESILSNQKEELLKQRRIMWEESAHGVGDFDDIIDMAIYDEQVRSENDHYVRRDEAVRQMKYLLQTPYFGRIDFVEEGETDLEQIYIGRYGFCDKKSYEYEIYDWRSPIASMFYDSSIGKASYRCPAGKIEGELTVKRQYRIVDGKLEYCYDTDSAVRDEILEDVLAGNTDKVLRVIVDTITRDQNEAIRKEHSSDILVTGPAGSGKTSVGMHRLAYLLYHNRDFLDKEKIVVLSRNEIFSSYVSGILPELGEENVQDVLFDRLIQYGIPRDFRKNKYYEQMEYLLQFHGDTIRRKSIKGKYSKEFISFIEEKVQPLRGRRLSFLPAMEKYLEWLHEFLLGAGKESYEYTKHALEQKQLMYEDFLLISYIRILSGDIRPQDHISHVVIDEAQDYNFLQLKLIKKLYPRSRFTILADPHQAVYPETSTIDNDDFRQVFGNRLTEMQLKKSYRSTAPINRYALSILGIDDKERYVDRPGKEPETVVTGNPREELLSILEKTGENRSIGILTCDKASAIELRNHLGQPFGDEERKVQYIFHPDRMLEEKVVVMPVLLAKGLEFDVVIIWDDKAEAFWTENKNLKYLMCTRALHELYQITTE